MSTQEEVDRRRSRLAAGPRSIRQSAEGTNDWLDDITETVTDTTAKLNTFLAANEGSREEILPILRQLVDLSMRMITMRHDVESGQPPRGPVDNDGRRGEDDEMEARITALEKDVAAIKTDVAVIRSNYATKEDLQKELHGVTWKIIGAMGLICAAVFWMARNVEPPRSAAATPAYSTPAPQAPAPAQPPAK